MKLINNVYTHKEENFNIQITTCNKKLATDKNLETKEVTKFNRGKLEWMINKGVFTLNEALTEQQA
jgi:hypothetical protein